MEFKTCSCGEEYLKYEEDKRGICPGCLEKMYIETGDDFMKFLQETELKVIWKETGLFIDLYYRGLVVEKLQITKLICLKENKKKEEHDEPLGFNVERLIKKAYLSYQENILDAHVNKMYELRNI